MRDETRKALLAATPPGGAASWQQRVGAYSRLPALLRELGADPDAVLAAAGLARGALEAPDRTIPFAAVGRLLDLATTQTGCPHVGVLSGRLWRLEDLGLLGDVVRHSATVGEALRTLAVHQQLNSSGGLAFLLERPGAVDLGYAIYHPGVVGTDQLFDGAIAAGVQFLRELCGPGFQPTDVLLPHAIPNDLRPYRALFRITPHFNAEVAALRFPASWMAKPVEGASPARRDAAMRQLEQRTRGELVPRAMRALRLLMLHGDVSGEATARMLSMHRRTLNRRLKAQGTTFQFVLDRVRFDAARELLEGTNLTLDDIAAALGYASVSPFMRSFRRWTGSTPGQWRRLSTRERRSAVTAHGSTVDAEAAAAA